MADFYNPQKEVSKRLHKLPHWQQADTWIFMTWRLADSLPLAVVEKWKIKRGKWLNQHPKPWDDETFSEYNKRFTSQLESLLDDAHGSCCLSHPQVSQIVTDSLHYFDGQHYQLDSYVVMPNHVHVLSRILENHTLSETVQSWKRHTSRKINKALNQSGRLWQPDYWDRLIRSQKHFDWTKRYIQENPKNLAPKSFRLWSADL